MEKQKSFHLLLVSKKGLKPRTLVRKIHFGKFVKKQDDKLPKRFPYNDPFNSPYSMGNKI